MVTILATSDPKRRLKSTPTLAITSAREEHKFKEQRFVLAYNLQTSLELNEMLEQFFSNIQDLVTTTGLVYRYPEANIDVRIGDSCQHSITYNLTNEDIKLGNIVFSRAKRFAETELAALEMLIGVLFFPLRNAILYKKAIESSLSDALTGVGNRAAMEANFERELKLAKRHDTPLSVLLIDIDHFKHVNDSAGHYGGDLTLKHIVETIKNSLRETDQVFRFGGEEFVALLHNTDSIGAETIAERIRLCVAESPICIENNHFKCTVSIGVSVLTGNEDGKELIQRADEALYEAKNLGRNRVEIWAPSLGKEQKLA